jgi:Cyclic nucleotide-binding domain
VVTFGADGGYGHPDHVAISELTTQAFRAQVRDHDRGQRLYHAVFPPRHTCMAEELARWIADSGQQAIALFAAESATMRLARDDVRVQWFPAGACVIEPGEPADALYLILSGTVDRLLERPDGQVIHVRRMRAGDFFGERGLVAGKRPARVVARESLTCLVLSRTPIRPYAGRGVGASRAVEPPPGGPPSAGPPGTYAVDVTSYLDRKLGALARHPVPGHSLGASPELAAEHARHRVLPPHRRWQPERLHLPLREGAASPAARGPFVAAAAGSPLGQQHRLIAPTGRWRRPARPPGSRSRTASACASGR